MTSVRLERCCGGLVLASSQCSGLCASMSSIELPELLAGEESKVMTLLLWSR